MKKFTIPNLILFIFVLMSMMTFSFYHSSLAFAEQVVTEDPMERKMLDIAKDLRCAVCQNQPVSESNADLARDMRVIIREQLEAGKSHDEIVNYFVERYGDYVLMKPPARGAGTIVWAVPLALIIVVGVSGFVFLRRRLREPVSPPPTLTKADAALVRAARKKDQS